MLMSVSSVKVNDGLVHCRQCVVAPIRARDRRFAEKEGGPLKGGGVARGQKKVRARLDGTKCGSTFSSS